MKKPRVLFVCVHNSARSQIAEAYLKKFAGADYEVLSAGLVPGTINPFVIDVMKEEGIDISHNKTTSVFELFKEGKHMSVVITVCERKAEEKCPIFPGAFKRLHWSFDDPSKYQGSRDEILKKTRILRDEIKDKILHFIDEMKQKSVFDHES